jgi:hypothetical protein
MRLPDDLREAGEKFLKDAPQWFFSIELAESDPDDRLALLGLLARIIRRQDERIDRAVQWYNDHFKKESHLLDLEHPSRKR